MIILFVLLFFLVLAGIFGGLVFLGKRITKKQEEEKQGKSPGRSKRPDSSEEDQGTKFPSVQEFYPFTIDNGFLKSDTHLLRVSEIGSANMFAKSERETKGLFNAYRRFIVSLQDPIQIIIQSRQVDISDYMEYFMPHVEKIAEQFGEEHEMTLFARHIAQHIRETNTERRTIRRNFLVHPKERTGDWEMDQNELDRKTLAEINGIKGCDLNVSVLSDITLAELIQGFIAKPRTSTVRVRDVNKFGTFSLRVQGEETFERKEGNEWHAQVAR